MSNSFIDFGFQIGPLRCWPGGLCLSRSIGDMDVGEFIVPIPHVKQVKVGHSNLCYMCMKLLVQNFFGYMDSGDAYQDPALFLFFSFLRCSIQRHASIFNQSLSLHVFVFDFFREFS